MKAPRTIAVKMLVNADEFVDFANDAEVEDKSHSKLLRDLWLASRNGKTQQRPAGRPSAVQNLAMYLPGRANYGARPAMHMRL